MARVIISSGHTSASPGSIANGLREVDLARQIAKATLYFLRYNGIISLSVPPEMDLVQRIDWINKSGYQAKTNDIAVEIHINDGGKSGFEAWFEGDGMNASQQLTELMLNEVVLNTRMPNQGAKSEYKHEIGSISFLHDTITVSSLIECGYIDNPQDAAFLKQPANIYLIGKSLAKGICKFLNVEYRDIPPNTIPQNNRPQQVTQQTPVMTTQAVNSFNNNSGFTNFQQQPTNQNIYQQQQVPAFTPTPSLQPTPQANTQSTQAFSVNQNVPQMQSRINPPAPVTPLTFNPPTNNVNAQPLPSREERKKVITDTYQRILGHEPSQNDLNYFLNMGIREEELIRKMIDSQEHADLLKAKQELQTIKTTFDSQKIELDQLRAAVTDQKQIIEGLNYSIVQKNGMLMHFQDRLNQVQASLQNQPNLTNSKKPEPVTSYKGTFLDRLFKAFSDLFD